MPTITVENVGPVKNVAIECPPEGGIVVLKGRNGRGKSKTLEAVEAAMSGRGKPEVRDGAARGKVEGYGVKLTLGKRQTRSGELEVESLEGKLDLAALVDPGLKSAEAADAKRIKALVQLAGVPADEELFYGLIGGREQFQAAMAHDSGRPPDMEDLDLTEMAALVKRELEDCARLSEREAVHFEGQEKARLAAAEGARDGDAPDERTLAEALEQAVRDEAAVNARATAATNAAYAAANAKRKLAEAEAGYRGPTRGDAEKSLATAQALFNDAQADLASAEAALNRCKETSRQRAAELDAARSAQVAATNHESTIAAWREQLAADAPAPVSIDEQEAAAQRVSEARKAVEDGAVLRQKLKSLAAAKEAKALAHSHRERAARFREAAAGTDGVLSQAVAKTGSPLRVDDGRLVLSTHRGPTKFADLSAGERWRIALDVAIESVGDEGVFVIPQEAYEGLDPIARREIAEHVAERRVVVLTAEASDDEEIVVEQFAPDATGTLA